MLLASDQGCISLLVLLDLSAAFDNIDHDILIDRLQNYTGIQGQALRWFRSYLSDRYHFVYLNGESSQLSPVKYGVPQGSVLGPLLFSLYMLPLGNIIRKYGISFHCYADDTPLYISTKPDETSKLSKLTECVKNIKDWMNSNYLLLNSDKTEILLIGPKNSTQNLLDYNLQLVGCNFTSSTVKNLGVILDSNLSFKNHISNVTKTAFFHLRNISKLGNRRKKGFFINNNNKQNKQKQPRRGKQTGKQARQSWTRQGRAGKGRTGHKAYDIWRWTKTGTANTRRF